MIGRAPGSRGTRITRKGERAAQVAHAAHTGRIARAVTEISLLIIRSVLWVGFTTVGVAINIWGAVTLLLLITPGNPWGYIAMLLGAAIAGSVSGVIMSIGQVMALRRWLDGAASLASFLSTVIASSLALAVGTCSGWWAHTVAGDLIGALVGLMAYGGVFGFLQRPMVEYMADRSLLWVPVNAAASVLGAMAMLAAFDVSGGRRDTLQFKYVGIVYAIITGVAFLLMTHTTRRAMTARSVTAQHADAGDSAAWPPAPAPGVIASGPRFEFGSTNAPGRGPGYQAGRGAHNLGYTPDYASDLVEIHEHRIYTMRRGFRHVDSESGAHEHGSGFADGQGLAGPADGQDTIDTTYRVIP